MKKLIAFLFVVVGIINLLPVIGVTSAAQLEEMYRVTLTSSDLVLLMRHRAVLLSIVGGLMFAAAWRPELRTAAIIANFTSMFTFVALSVTEANVNPALVRITAVDVFGLVALIGAAGLHWSGRSN